MLREIFKIQECFVPPKSIFDLFGQKSQLTVKNGSVFENRNRSWVVRRTSHRQNMVQIVHFHNCNQLYRNFHFLGMYFSMLGMLAHHVVRVLWKGSMKFTNEDRISHRENLVPLGDCVDWVSFTVQTISDWKCIFVALVASIAQLKRWWSGISGRVCPANESVMAGTYDSDPWLASPESVW